MKNLIYLLSKFLVVWHLCILKKPFRKKIDQNSKNSKKRICRGNSDNSKCYLIGSEDKKGELKIQMSRNVRFKESEYYFKHKKTQ